MKKIFKDIEDELIFAKSQFKDFNSNHEGYAVIKEELEELWDLIKKSHKINANEKMKKECVQIAAMAIRFIIDL